MKLKKRVSIKVRKPDTSDGISNTAGKVIIIKDYSCDKGHPVTRHRRRNGHDQYYCTQCNSYSTDYEKPTSNPSYFDGFIKDYIEIALTNKKLNIRELCYKHSLSRATLYRYVFSKTRKLELDALICLSDWLKKTQGNVYQRDVIDGNLVIKKINTHFILTLTTEAISDSRKSFTLKGKFSKPISLLEPTELRFDASNKSFEITPLDLNKLMTLQLASLEKILKT